MLATHSILPKITAYHFPEAAPEQGPADDSSTSAKAAGGDSKGRHNAVDFVEQMRARAASNRTFIYVKVPPSQVCVCSCMRACVPRRGAVQ